MEEAARKLHYLYSRSDGKNLLHHHADEKSHIARSPLFGKFYEWREQNEGFMESIP